MRFGNDQNPKSQSLVLAESSEGVASPKISKGLSKDGPHPHPGVVAHKQACK